MNPPTRPNLFIVGAPKAGTSALAAYLAQHPQVSACAIKEPNFLCRDLDLPGPKSEAEYLSLFGTTEHTRYWMDASILSMHSKAAAAAIAEYAESPRILMILRDPVEAMHAWHGQMVFTANEPLREFGDALAAEADRKAGRRVPSVGTTSRCPSLLFYRDVMAYADQVERYLKLFDRDRILILSYDDLKADTPALYAEVVAFLGLDPAFEPDFRVLNPSQERRSWRLHHVLKQAFARPARALLPAKLRLALIERLDRMNSRPAPRSPIEPALERSLRAECRADVERLAQLVGRDFSHWCE